MNGEKASYVRFCVNSLVLQCMCVICGAAKNVCSMMFYGTTKNVCSVELQTMCVFFDTTKNVCSMLLQIMCVL